MTDLNKWYNVHFEIVISLNVLVLHLWYFLLSSILKRFDLKKTNVAIDLIKSIVYFKHVYKGQSSSFDPIFITHTYQCDKPEGSENR